MRTVKVQRVPVDKIVRAAVNANHMAKEVYERLREAMRALGTPDLQPLLVTLRDDGMFDLIDGHHRLDAAVELGAVDVLCVVAELPEGARKLLGLGMNRLRGEVDLKEAADILQEVERMLTGVEDGLQTGELLTGSYVGDLALAGFGDDELVSLLDAGKGHEDEAIHPEADLGLDDGSKPPPKPFLLELTFGTRADLNKVKRKLRHAAGESKDLSEGLLRIVEGA